MPLKERLQAALRRARAFLNPDRPVESSLPDDSASTLEGQKQLIARLLLEESGARYAVSYSQEALWFVNRLNPLSGAGNLPVGLRLRGPLDLPVLERSLQEIITRQSALRTRFELIGTQLCQIVLPKMVMPLVCVDLTDITEPSREAEAECLALKEARVPFDLTQAPLFRAKLLRLGPEHHIFICVMHQTISDGWSLRVFVNELLTLYDAFSRGLDSPLEPISFPFAEYAAWQRETMKSVAARRQIAYWCQKLRGAAGQIDLRITPEPAGSASAEAGSQVVALPAGLVSGLKRISAEHGATLVMVALAAFAVLIWQISASDDILIGLPYAGRSLIETEPVIGNFVNMLLLRTKLEGDLRFCDLLEKVRESTLEALSNSDVPHAKLFEDLDPIRIQITFSSIKATAGSQHAGSLSLEPYCISTGNLLSDLTLYFIEGVNDAWAVEFDYSLGIFSHERIRRLLSEFLGLLETAAAQPMVALSALTAQARQSAAVETQSPGIL
ncbi:MAG: hypothetical protein JO336_14600 [Acidobacteriia bacterium]|nr:hypothetical protein [Terriglobia bacterium]MBV8905139.1 hypothetical protein [Terriglobia bacterium]